MGMFDSIGWSIKIWFLEMTGRVDEANKLRMKKPVVIRAVFDEALAAKKTKVQEFMKAIAGLMKNQENKKSEKERLNAEVARHEAVMQGARALALKRTKVLQAAGKTNEEILKDPEVLKHQGAYTDMKSTTATKKARITQLEEGIARLQGQIEQHTISLEALHREVQSIVSEADDAVARQIAATQEKELADYLAGLSTKDSSDAMLNQVRDVVKQSEAEAEVASHLAGTGTAVTEANYLAEAAEAEASSEFAELLGLAEKVETSAKAPDAPAPEPEKLS